MSINIKDLMRPIYKANLVLLQSCISSGKFDKEIGKLKKLKPTREKILKDKNLQEKFRCLTDKILQELQLPPKLFKFYIVWYLLYGKFDAPGLNFLVIQEKDSVLIEFFRRPHTNDWKLAKEFVNSAFKNYPTIQKSRIDPRLLKTIDRRIVVDKETKKLSKDSKFTSKSRATYEVIDLIWKDTEKEPHKDKQRSQIVRQDRVRQKKLTKKLGLV